MLQVEVADNGVGCPPHPEQGLGSRLVRLLAAQIGGEVVQLSNDQGCQVTVTIPERALPTS